MKPDELTELEMFRLATSMAGASLAGDERLAQVGNPEDVMTDRIMDCHSAIQAAAPEILGRPDGRAH